MGGNAGADERVGAVEVRWKQVGARPRLRESPRSGPGGETLTLLGANTAGVGTVNG